MKGICVAAFVFSAAILSAQSPSTLQKGPSLVDSIPLDPPQSVPAWKAVYRDSGETVWVYATSSVYFRIIGKVSDWGTFSVWRSQAADSTGKTYTAWIVKNPEIKEMVWIFFFPEDAEPKRLRDWIFDFFRQFRELDKLPQKGAPILFPAVLLDR